MISGWTSLLQASHFDGLRTDLVTLAGGVVTVGIVIMGINYLSGAFHR